ncbi:MAG: hypothetical protein IPJ77_10315 [Planctomycetes bacterium]|nr:hypothetical protein [Planctomycetota bacterium]
MLTLLLALALVSAPQSSDEKAPPAAAQTPAVDPKLVATLAAAMRALDGGKGTRWIGAVEETQPAEEEDEGPGNMRIMIGGPGDDAGEPFHGPIEVLRTETKELLLASLGALPEVVIYDDGAQRLVRTTIAGEPVATKRLADDLGSLLDFGRLASNVEKCTKLTAWDPAADGARAFECELPPRSVRSEGGGMRDMMAPKVLAVRARFDLDGQGALVALRFDVTRSDPTAGFRRKALEGVAQGGGGGERVVQFNGGMPKNDEPGPTAVYELRASNELPSARAREALLALRKLAETK